MSSSFFLSFFFIISAEHFQLLSLVSKKEIFEWSAGLLLYLSIDFAHKSYLHLRDYLLKFVFIV